jgi:hypothetical protein
MASTLPPDPLLDALKSDAGVPPGADLEVSTMARALPRNAIPAGAARPWTGERAHVVGGMRWFSRVVPLNRLGIRRAFRVQIAVPVYDVVVAENGVGFQLRWDWLTRVVLALRLMLLPDLQVALVCGWEDITGIRRRARTWRSWSTIEFCTHGRWWGVATMRTRALDEMWDAVVHFHRTSRSASDPNEAGHSHHGWEDVA